MIRLLDRRMFEWVNYHNVHMAIRVVTGTYFTVLVGWTLYKHFLGRRGRSADDAKRLVAGDSLDQDEEDDEDEDD